MTSRAIHDLLPHAAGKCLVFLREANKVLAGTGLSVIVTWTRRSVHTQRRAWDMCFIDRRGRARWDGPWERLGEIAQSLDIEWGGKWPHAKDRCHFQVSNDTAKTQR